MVAAEVETERLYGADLRDVRSVAGCLGITKLCPPAGRKSVTNGQGR